jgi:hypothetical protein
MQFKPAMKNFKNQDIRPSSEGEEGRVRHGDGATGKPIILPKGHRDAIVNFDLGD